MKRIILVIVLIVSLSFLYGFSSNPNYVENINDFIILSMDFSSNGKIVQSIDFSVNSSRLSNEALNLKEEVDFKNALKKNIETIRNEFLFSFALKYIKNPVEEYKINKGVVLSTVSVNEENDCIGFKICFENLNAWNYYHNSSAEDGDKEKNNQNNIFINKVESIGLFPFSSTVKLDDNTEITVGEGYKQLYLKSAEGLSFYQKFQNMYKPMFVYNYSSFNNKLHSNCNYDFVDQIGHLHHVWTIKEENLNKNNQIKLYFYLINKGFWILFATIIPLIIMMIFILIIKLKKK